MAPPGNVTHEFGGCHLATSANVCSGSNPVFGPNPRHFRFAPVSGISGPRGIVSVAPIAEIELQLGNIPNFVYSPLFFDSLQPVPATRSFTVREIKAWPALDACRDMHSNTMDICLGAK